jgi:hypothetical protein
LLGSYRTAKTLHKQHQESLYQDVRLDDFYQICKNKPFWKWGAKHHLTWKYCSKCNRKYPENGRYCKDCNKKWEQNKEENLENNIFPELTLRFNDDLILNPEEPQDCCFTHIIGCPVKDFKIPIPGTEQFYRERTTLPIFDWQKKLFEAFEAEEDNLIIKAGGIGGSALKLRQTAYRICSHNDYNKTQVPIIVGPEKGLAQVMLKRFKDLFPFQIYDNKNTCQLNNCWLHVFASRNIAGIRSLENPRELFFDEFDFFPLGDMSNVLDTMNRYMGKSGAKVNAMSTPNKPYGYCHSLEEDPMDFTIIKIPYGVALGTVLSYVQIEIAKKKHGFDREYNLVYGGTTGNYFDEVDIKSCISEYSLSPIKEATTVMGIDSGWSSSFFAIVILSYVRGNIYVMHVERHKNPHPQFMLDRVAELKREYYVYKILTDGADPQWIYQLKDRFKDVPPLKYNKNIENIYDYHSVPQGEYIDMKVIPTSFTKKVMQYLNQDKSLLKNPNRILKIHKKFGDMVNALYEVYVEQGAYKKENSTLNDIVDAFSEGIEFFTTKNIIKLV